MYKSVIFKVVLGYIVLLGMITAQSLYALRVESSLQSQVNTLGNNLTGIISPSSSVTFYLQDSIRWVLLHRLARLPKHAAEEEGGRLAIAEQSFEKTYSTFQEHLEALKANFSNAAQLEGLEVLTEKSFSLAREHLGKHRESLKADKLARFEAAVYDEDLPAFRKVIEKYEKMHSEDMPKLPRDIRFIRSQAENADGLLKRLLSTSTEDELWVRKSALDRYWKYMSKKTQKLGKYFPEAEQEIAKSLAVFDRAINQPGGIVNSQLNLLKSRETAEKIMEELETVAGEAINQLHSLNEQLNIASQESQKEASQNIDDALWTTLFILFLCIAIALFIVASMWLLIRRELTRITSSLRNLAQGILSHQKLKTGRDEFGQIAYHINAVQDTLCSIVESLQNNASTLNLMIDEAKSASENTREQVHQQKTQTESMTSALSQMKEAVIEVAQHAETSRVQIDETNSIAKSNEELVKRNIHKIVELDKDLERAVVYNEELQQEANNISEILSEIESIANRTNLLALNAAIEAARAGEQGRGFSVVADEVRGLASQTRASTEKSSELISRLQEKTKITTELMLQNRDKAQNCVLESEQTGRDWHNLMEYLNQINQMSSSIAAASEEQGAMSEAIYNDMLTIDQTTDKAIVTADRLANSSEKLSDMAYTHDGLVSRFTMAD